MRVKEDASADQTWLTGARTLKPRPRRGSVAGMLPTLPSKKVLRIRNPQNVYPAAETTLSRPCTHSQVSSRSANASGWKASPLIRPIAGARSCRGGLNHFLEFGNQHPALEWIRLDGFPRETLWEGRAQQEAWERENPRKK